jgi:hypothetical protein
MRRRRPLDACDATGRRISLADALGAVTFAFSILGGTIALAAALKGTVTKDDVIRAEPAPAAAAVGNVKTGATVSVLDRNGFWRRVEGPAGKGWLKMSSVRVDSGVSAGAGLAALATGRGATGNIVTTSGTRGISVEALTDATPDKDELQRLEELAVSPEQARAFADEAGLTERKVGYFTPATGGKSPPEGKANGS